MAPRDLSEQIRAGAQDSQLSLTLGELVAREVQERQQPLAAGLVQALIPYGREHTTHLPSSPEFPSLLAVAICSDVVAGRLGQRAYGHRCGAMKGSTARLLAASRPYPAGERATPPVRRPQWLSAHRAFAVPERSRAPARRRALSHSPRDHCSRGPSTTGSLRASGPVRRRT